MAGSNFVRPKGEKIYRRSKNVEIEITPEKDLVVEVSMEDSSHEMRLIAVFSRIYLDVRDIHCEMRRFPHEECTLALESLKPLIGKRIQPGFMNNMKELIGNKGCTHLTNLFHEACYCAVQAQGIVGRSELQKIFPGITEEQIFKIFTLFRPDLMDSCVCYREGASFMQAVQKAPFPPDIEKLKALR